ncbi:hypothetical protein, partial [Vibrio aestuarianus]|uniref:hypothetical protein n=1 Tax=Vibrio aestuarianus TaxID=28171 RepID=UPI0021C3C0B6
LKLNVAILFSFPLIFITNRMSIANAVPSILSYYSCGYIFGEFLKQHTAYVKQKTASNSPFFA